MGPLPFVYRLRGWLIHVAAALLFLNLIVLIGSVAARYLIGASPIWSDELARYSVIGCVMMAAGAVWVEGGHMQVSLLDHRMPGPIVKWLRAYKWLLALAVFSFATWASYRYAIGAGRFRSMGLGVSRTWPLMALPIGFGLLVLQMLLQGPWPKQEHLDRLNERAHS
ncbi:TRAP transporter small permease [Pseudomonas sp. Marseille-QA0892]